MLKKKYLLLLFIFLVSVPANSQKLSDSASSGYYKVKPGDSAKYIYNNVYNRGSNPLISFIVLPNGTFMSYNISNGISLTINVITVNMSADGRQQVYSLSVLKLSNQNPIYSQISAVSPYINPAFNNEQEVQAFLNNTASQVYSGFGINYTYSLDANYINQTYNIPENNLYIVYSYDTDWKTGWVVYYTAKTYDSQHNLISSYTFVKVNDFYQSVLNYLIDVFLVVLGTAVLLILAIIYFKYKKFIDNTQKRERQFTFLNYIIMNLKKSFKAKPKKKNHPEKALEMIDEIILENKSI